MAVAEETLADGRAGRLVRLSRPGIRLLAFVVAAAFGVALVVGGLVAFHESLAGRILPGISVGGVDVGSLTPAEARVALVDRLRPLGQGALTIRSSVGSTIVSFADLRREADVDAALATAAALGRGGSWLDETVAAIRLRLQPETIPLHARYDAAAAGTAVNAFADRMTLNAIDATVLTTTAGFVVIPSVDGARIDPAPLLAAIDVALRDPATPSSLVVDASVLSASPVFTTDRAAAMVASAQRMVGDLAVSGGGSKWTIRAATVRSWISVVRIADEYRVVVDRNAIGTSLASIARKVAKPVHDAAFLRDKRGHIVGAKADEAGRALDAAATADRISAALDARTAGAGPDQPVALAIAPVAPRVTTAEATQTAPLMVRLGAWTTFYPVGAHNGFGANITIPARTLDGTVVRPGEMFDFWQALGEVSFRTGYRLGGAIINGHSVEGKALAGGICAASTTLFNAALRAGYEIDTRAPHWYYLTRYPLGLDATVSGGEQTMRFRNDTPYPLLIRGIASPGVVRFEIWSIPNGRTVSLSKPIVMNVIGGYDTVVRTSSLPAGTQKRTEWPDDGKDVWVTRTVRDASGHVIHRETYFSHYHRMVGILLIGTG